MSKTVKKWPQFVKKCFVPSCKNTNKICPDKLFMNVPITEERRNNWFVAVGLVYTRYEGKTYLLCCEDHFNLEDDVENWQSFKLMGGPIRFKKHIVPHLFLDGSSRNIVSQLSESARERQKENIERLARAKQVKKEKDTTQRPKTHNNIASTSKISKVVSGEIEPALPSVIRMGNLFQCTVFWPTAEEISRTLPLPFRAIEYHRVQSIIDCFEIEIYKSFNPTIIRQKKCDIVKILISSTPSKCVNFVSAAFKATISNEKIVLHSKYLEKLPNRADVMADSGFQHLASDLARKGCTLITPHSAFRDGAEVGALRIQIERVIRRLRLQCSTQCSELTEAYNSKK